MNILKEYFLGILLNLSKMNYSDMLGKDLDISSLQATFLLVFYNRRSLTGTEIVLQISKNLGPEYAPSPGTTYKTLQKLQEKEFITETTEKEDLEDKRLRTYTLTSKGEEMVKKLADQVMKYSSFLEKCCPDCCTEIVCINGKKG